MRSASKQPTSWQTRARPWREAIAVLILLAVPASTLAQRLPDDPRAVAAAALSSLLLGEHGAFRGATIDTPGIDVLVRPSPPSADERTRIEETLSRVRLSSRYPPLFEGEPVEDGVAPRVGTRRVYTTQLGSSLVPVVVVQTPDGWRVDPRYWVAEREQQTDAVDQASPTMVAKRFLAHVMDGETEALASLSTEPASVEALTRHNTMPGADRGHVAMLCMEMPVARAREGEVIRMPGGTRVVVAATPDEAVYVGLLGSIEVPFRLRRVGGAWKVVPEPYFEWLRVLGAI